MRTKNILRLLSVSSKFLPEKWVLRRALEPLSEFMREWESFTNDQWVETSWEKWKIYNCAPLLSHIQESFQTSKTLWKSEDGKEILIYEVGDVTLACYCGDSKDFRSAHSLDEIKEAVLSSLPRGDFLTLDTIKSEWGSSFSLSTSTFPSFPKASVVTTLENRLSRELSFGSRSVLFHGPPGTGKSVAARQLARLSGENIFVLSGAGTLNGGLEFAVSWNPDAIVIDDIDHAMSGSFLDFLNVLENARKKIPLIIATANDLSRIPAPLLRPGRLDHIVEISTVDETLAREFFPEIPPEDLSTLISLGVSMAILTDFSIRLRSFPEEREILLEEFSSRLSSKGGSLPSSVEESD